MHRPVLVAAAAATPVTQAEAKAHLRIDSSDEDGLIDTLLAAATGYLAGHSGILGRCLVNETWRQDFSAWPGSRVLRLPFPDVSSVTVKYYDGDNAEQTVSASLYETLEDARGAYVRFRDDFAAPTLYADRSDGVQVTLVAGFGAAGGDVPAAIRAAVLLFVAHLFLNREAVGESMSEIPLGVAALIEPYRRVGV